MSSKVVPTVHIDPDTDALASTSIAGSPLATVRIEEPSLHNTRESPLATARIEEPSRNDTAGGTEAAQTITAVSAISGLGLGFGLESDGGAGARTNGSAPARHGVRLVDALSTSNSQDIQQWQHGASDTAGKSAAGGGCRDQQCREDSSGGLGNGERSTEHPRSSSVGDGADNSAMSPTSSAAKFAADGHGERTSTHGAQNDIEVAANLARVGSPLTSRANAADDDSRGKHGTGASHLKLKTVAHLPGMMGREHIASYAEEHEADVSAEINSLSKISAQDEVEEPTRFLFQHESSQKLAWDIFMMVLIIFSSFANPLQIGFDEEPQGGLWIFEVLVDFVFFADVCLSFRTTVMDSATKETITDVKDISIRYLKSWFLLDALSSLPVALVSHLVDVTGTVGRYFLALKLLRTLKLHQLSVITNAVLKRFEDQDFNPAAFRIYVFVLAFILVVHFIACGYWFVSRTTDPEFEGLWTPEEEYLDASLFRKYSRALYFSLVITYGNDLKPENDAEYAFSNVCLTLALLANAVIIGSATNLLSNMDAGAVAKKTQMDGINGYMRFRKVPKGLQKKIRTFYEYLWDSGQDSHSSGLFEEMPEKLKLQLNIALNKRLIDQVPLFKTFSPAGTIALVQNLVPSIVLPGELIVRQGEPATSMFFISRGTVGVFVVPEGDDPSEAPAEESYVISLGAGSFFGEVSLLEEEHLRTANVRAETFTELQVMHAEDFQALAEVFPEFKTAVEAISKSRKKAGEALGKMKARGKKLATRKTQRTTTEGPSRAQNMMQNAFAAVRAQNHAQRESDEIKLPRMRIWAERVMGVHRERRITNNETVKSAVSVFSGRGGGRGYLDRDIRTVYDTIVAHEALVSHEAAIRVAKGGGIARENLITINRA